MRELVINDLDAGVLQNLQALAAIHGRTPAEEAKNILANALGDKPKGEWTAVDAIYHRLAASGRTFSDSAELLREDRDR